MKPLIRAAYLVKEVLHGSADDAIMCVPLILIITYYILSTRHGVRFTRPSLPICKNGDMVTCKSCI